MIDLLHEIPVIGRILLVVLTVFIVLLSAQLTQAVFSSFRSWRFTIFLIVFLWVACLGLIHLYAVSFILPGAEESAVKEYQEEHEDKDD